VVLNPWRSGRLVRTVTQFPRFVRQWLQYRRSSPALVRVSDWYPCLDDNTVVTSFDSHYFYQSAWAARKLFEQKPSHHVDVGSQIDLIAPLTGFLDAVEFVDIRPLEAALPNLRTVKASILELLYESCLIRSASCLHVVEHIGLGRYGDSIDPDGMRKACKELLRVLAIGEHLYISVPVGHERTEFNAHRIVHPAMVPNLFSELRLIEFSCVDDGGIFHANAAIDECTSFEYGLGLYHFVRPSDQ
jgi:hypothetical protein